MQYCLPLNHLYQFLIKLVMYFILLHLYHILDIELLTHCQAALAMFYGRGGGLMVSALDSGLKGPGLNPSRGCPCSNTPSHFMVWKPG